MADVEMKDESKGQKEEKKQVEEAPDQFFGKNSRSI